MKLKLSPSNKSADSCYGFIIKGDSLAVWLHKMTALKVNLKNVNVYPLPGSEVNSVWGCFVETKRIKILAEIQEYQKVQLIGDFLYIPEFSEIYPKIQQEELNQFMLHKKSLYHPEIGLVELSDPLDFREFIEFPELKSKFISTPEEGIRMPYQVKSMLIKSQPPEDILKQFEEKEFPKTEKFEDKPLNPIEKVKLKFFKGLFKSKDDSDKPAEPTKFLNKMAQLFFGKEKKEASVDKMRQNYEGLEERNQKELNKLLNMLKKNPLEALKYAIPLDNASRGSSQGNFGNFRLGKIWNNLNIFGSAFSGGGGSFTDEDAHSKLLNQYHLTAQELIKKGDFKEAAFVYLKLLKSYHLAATTLEKGGYYAEASSIYLKYLNNTIKAAECFEKGHLYEQAIEQYKVNQKNEKVGDLYKLINNDDAATSYYNKAVENSLHINDYFHAAEIQTYKLDDKVAAKKTLVDAWDKNIQAEKCLTHLLNNSEEDESKKQEINQIFKSHLNINNYEPFIKVMRNNFSKNDDLSEHIKDLSLQTISRYSKKDMNVLRHLPYFNQADAQIKKDVVKYSLRNEPRK